jgi:DNA-binding CsgD family transcriptional regulator
MGGHRPRSALLGRRRERERLSGLVTAARQGRSQALVLRGEAGVGKTALLDFLVERSAGCTVVRAAGVESERELDFAGLHQLCGPFLDRLGRLPVPQRQALGTTFGLQSGTAPDRLLVGLAVLTLLSEVAAERTLICVVDNAQWLDPQSAQALEFVAHRLTAEPVAMVLAVRDGEEQPRLTGLPELVVGGLSNSDATALLESAVSGPLDPQVRERVLAESHGNPLVLRELPRALPAAGFTLGGAADAAAAPLIHRLEQGFLRQVEPLPWPSRHLLLTAAAEPLGDIPLLWRAARRLGIGPAAATAAEAAGLIELRDRARFRHLLVRSAVYRSATPAQRREVHRALADVTDPETDPERRAWHRAHAAVGPDEAVAADLEHSAGRALSHGGPVAAAALLETAMALTPDPARRARRALDAAQAKATAGSFADALDLLTVAREGPLPEAGQARVDLLSARIGYDAEHGNDAVPLLLAAAQRLGPLDPELAREARLDVLSAALFAGRLATGAGLRQVAEAVRPRPVPDRPDKSDLLAVGLAALATDGYAAAVPLLRRAVQGYADENLTLTEALRGTWLAAVAAIDLWDDVHWDILSRRQLAAARAAGALSVLPPALTSRIIFDLFSGDLAEAGSLVREIRWTAEVSGGENTLTPYGEVGMAALRGRQEQAESLIQDGLNDCFARGQGLGVTMLYWARALLGNGLARYHDALHAAQQAVVAPLEPGPAKLALPELIEAAAHSGRKRLAAAAFEQLSALTTASGTEYARAVEAASRALVSSGAAAEELHREAIGRLGRTSIRIGLARAHLRYGEWLRREGRRSDARHQLRTAYETLHALGVEGFARRARRGLLATGETVRRRTADTGDELTGQEAHIARLAGEGLTNVEIAAALYISPRTVEWHLRKIFAKVGVSTRRQLRGSGHDGDPDRQS